MSTLPWPPVLVALWVATATAALAAEPALEKYTETVETCGVVLRLSGDNGAFSELASTTYGLSLKAPAGASENFRLLVGAPDESCRLIRGRDQRLSSLTRTDEEVQLLWKGPLVDTEGGTHDIDVRMTVRFRCGGAQIQLSLENNTGTPVAEV